MGLRMLWLISVLVVCGRSAAECPHPEDSHPCYCEEEEGQRFTMHCNYLTESGQIRKALGGLSGYALSTLSVWTFTSGVIGSRDFAGPDIREVVFTNSALEMEAPQFAGQESSLDRIRFVSSFGEQHPLRPLDLAHLDSLKEITFEKNDIRVLGNGWIKSVGSRLRSVTFDSCKVEVLGDRVFANLPSLTTLYVNDNKVSSIARSMFPKNPEGLRSINFSGNEIASLPADIFEDMPSLKVIEMERNNLKSVSEDTWSPIIESLSRIYLDENPIRCGPLLKWITKKSLPKIFTGKCNEPSKLKNKSLRTLMPADFH